MRTKHIVPARAAHVAKRGIVVALAACLMVLGLAGTASANEDGTWSVGEFALWDGLNQDNSSGIWDTSLNGLGNYATSGKRFINTTRSINDRAASSGNAKSFRIYLFADPLCGGVSVTHLAYLSPCPNPQVCWGYSNLGPLNDRGSSHWNAASC